MSGLQNAIDMANSIKAARVLRLGPPGVITNDDLPRPEPATVQLLVRVKAAGVGEWDALIREGKVEHQPSPLIFGSELSGIVEAIGPEGSGFNLGDEVYGARNEQFSGAYVEYELPFASMVARKPQTLILVEAAAVPSVSVTAWQMLFAHGRISARQTVLIHRSAGNVGAYSVQLASQAWLHVMATAASADRDYVRGLSAEMVIDYQTERFEEWLTGVDVVLDAVGGETQERSLRVLKLAGILVGSRGGAKTFWHSSSILLCGNNHSPAEQENRAVRRRKTGSAGRNGAPARGGSHCPRDAWRCAALARVNCTEHRSRTMRTRFALLPNCGVGSRTWKPVRGRILRLTLKLCQPVRELIPSGRKL